MYIFFQFMYICILYIHTQQLLQIQCSIPKNVQRKFDQIKFISMTFNYNDLFYYYKSAAEEESSLNILIL